MNFSEALDYLKQGKIMYRQHGSYAFKKVVMQKGYPQGIPSNKQTAMAWNIPEGSTFICSPYLQRETENNSHEMYLPSHEDIFADDWMYY